jgi:hypothetical protein
MLHLLAVPLRLVWRPFLAVMRLLALLQIQSLVLLQIQLLLLLRIPLFL